MICESLKKLLKKPSTTVIGPKEQFFKSLLELKAVPLQAGQPPMAQRGYSPSTGVQGTLAHKVCLQFGQQQGQYMQQGVAVADQQNRAFHRSKIIA